MLSFASIPHMLYNIFYIFYAVPFVKFSYRPDFKPHKQYFFINFTTDLN